jgi:predicted metalloprotease with PDZ domain
VIEGVDGILSEGLSGVMKGKLGRVAELHLGPYVLENVVAGFPDEDTMGHAIVLGQNGFVGNDVFKRFTVVFDYDGRRMFLKPNKRFTEPFEWNMAGLLFGMSRDGHLQVLEVMQASPGLEAGIRPGDIITAIDGRDVQNLDYEEIHRLLTREGEEVGFTITRDSRSFSLSLKLRRLI